jgi:uncharacterized protein YjlB
MDTVEPLKRLVQKVTGIGTPSTEEALASVLNCRPSQMRFADDGYIPNNPKYPLLYYRNALRFSRKADSAAVIEKIFSEHGWGDSRRNGIYDFVHYHSMIHEVLGIARGSATLRLGGNKGNTVKVASGDVIVIPAGVGHECLKASSTFLVVGAYPPTGTYNECRGSFQEHKKAIQSLRRVSVSDIRCTGISWRSGKLKTVALRCHR